MQRLSVDELLAQYTPDELSAIMAEELDAVGIPYTRSPDDQFVFVHIEPPNLKNREKLKKAY